MDDQKQNTLYYYNHNIFLILKQALCEVWLAKRIKPDIINNGKIIFPKLKRIHLASVLQ